MIYVIVSEIPTGREHGHGHIYLTPQEAHDGGFGDGVSEGVFTPMEMQQGGYYCPPEEFPCPVCVAVGGYCGGMSGHPSCGEFRDGEPVPLQ